MQVPEHAAGPTKSDHGGDPSWTVPNTKHQLFCRIIRQPAATAGINAPAPWAPALTKVLQMISGCIHRPWSAQLRVLSRIRTVEDVRLETWEYTGSRDRTFRQ